MLNLQHEPFDLQSNALTTELSHPHLVNRPDSQGH